MKKCPYCESTNDIRSIFCEKCGYELNQYNATIITSEENLIKKEENDNMKKCPYCESANDIDSIFCEKCGNNLNQYNATIATPENQDNINYNTNYYDHFVANLNEQDLSKRTIEKLDKIEIQVNICYYCYLIFGIIFCITIIGAIIGVPFIATAILIKQSYIVIKNKIIHNMIISEKQLEELKKLNLKE